MSWNIEVDDESHDAVVRAARRAGLSVREWLEAAIQHETTPSPLGTGRIPGKSDDLERRRQLAEAAGGLRRRIRALGPGAGARAREMEARLAGIEADLAALAVPAVTGTATGQRLDHPPGRVARLIENTDETARLAVEATDREAGLRKTLSDLEKRLAGLADPAPAAAVEPTAERINPDLKRRIERLVAQTRRPASESLADTLAALENRINGIRAEQQAREEASARAEEHERTRRIEEQLRAVAHDLDEPQSQPEVPGDDTDDLLSAIAGIAAEAGGSRRSEGAPPNPGLGATVSDIERLSADIAALGRRVDEAANDDRLGRAALSGQLDGLPQVDDLLHEIRVGLDRMAAEKERSLASHTGDILDVLSGSSGLQALHGEMEAIAAALDGRDDRTSLAQLEARMDDLARLVEIALNAGREAAEAGSDRMAADMAGLRRAIDDLAMDAPAPESIAFATLSANIADIREAVEGLAAPTASMESALVTRLADDLADIRETLAEAALGEQKAGIADVGNRLERLEETLAGPVSAQLEDLGTGFERLLELLADFDPGKATTAELEALRADIAVLRSDLAAYRPERIEGMEDRLSALAERVDAAAEPGASAEQLTDLESRVASLAADLSHSREQAAGLEQIETQLSRLQESLADGRAESIEAARAAALKAMEGLDKTDRTGAFQADLDRLREALGDARRETAEGRKSLDDTLADVSRRLERIERDGAEKPSRPVAEPASPAAPQVEAPVPQKTRPYARPMPPSEPEPAAEARPFDRKLAALRELAATSAEEERSSTTRRADFIAAARRAAKAAAEERDGLDTLGAGEPSPFARIGQAIRNRKKPLLLAAAAVVLTLGAIKFLGDGTGRPPSVAATPPPPPTEFVMTEQERNPVRRPLDEVIPGRDDAAALVAPPASADAAVAAGGARAASPGSFQRPPARETADSPSNGFDAMGGPVEPDILDEVPAGAVPPVGSEKLRRAALSGDPAAAFEIASRLAQGEGVARDPAASAVWYHRAADAGLAVAQYRLASLYERGVGVAVDHDKALIWYRQAAGQGHVGAMHNLAVLLSQSDTGSEAAGESVAWFEKAAGFGVTDSQFNLGVIYARGIGTQPDPVKAYKWFGIAARQGDQDAARRRDEVAATLKGDQLAAARSAVSAWQAERPLASANAVIVPEGGWGEPSGVAKLDQDGLVKTIQTLLAEKGYDPGPADGVDGPKTRQAIKAFQEKLGVAATGEIDGNLVTALVVAGG